MLFRSPGNPAPFLLLAHLDRAAPVPERQHLLRQAIERDFANPVPPFLLGETFAREDRPEEALAYFTMARLLNPDFHPAWQRRWALLEAQGEVSLVRKEREAWAIRARRWGKRPEAEDRTGADPLAGPE